jgi:hypothetical protein
MNETYQTASRRTSLSKVRFSIGSLMVGISYVGLILAALKSPSILWNSAFFSLTGGMLAIAILCLAYHEGVSRAFWLGFCVLGWGHFLLAFWGNEVPFLLTDYAVKYVQEQWIGLRYPTMGGSNLDVDRIRRQIVLSVLSLLIALVSGFVTARVFAARSVR